jgi:hypothetical protein
VLQVQHKHVVPAHQVVQHSEYVYGAVHRSSLFASHLLPYTDHPYSTPNSLQIKSYDKLIQLNTTLDLDKAYQDPYSSTLYGAVGMMINGVVFFTPLSAEGVDAINPPSGTQYTIVKANDHTSMNTGYTAENFDKCYGVPCLERLLSSYKNCISRRTPGSNVHVPLSLSPTLYHGLGTLQPSHRQLCHLFLLFNIRRRGQQQYWLHDCNRLCIGLIELG